MTKKIEIIELKNKIDILKLLFGARFIGQGNTSCCFLLQNGNLLKIYKNTPKKHDLFKEFSMVEHLCEISTLRNESYIVPDIIYIYQNQVIAYTTEYKNAKTLLRLNKQTNVESLWENLYRLMEDTYRLGDKKFALEDLHNKNILFNGSYYIIDLDFGKFKPKESIEKINKGNVRKIMETILDTLFGLKEWEELQIYDEKTFELYNQARFHDYRQLYLFFEELKFILNQNELRVKNLKRNRVLKKEYNTYYKSPL